MTKSLRTLIVDDEPLARSRIRALCESITEVEIVGEAESGASALARMTSDAADLVLLDIAMPELDGLRVARAVSTHAERPAIVFCTAHSAHALEAFDCEAVDYLLKPIDPDHLARAVIRARRWRAAGMTDSLRPDHLWVPNRDGMVRINLADIERIEAEGDYIRLDVGHAHHLLHESLARLEEKLDPKLFIRLRRSSIVRLDQITSIQYLGSGAWEALLRSGGRVRIGATYWKAVKSSLAM